VFLLIAELLPAVQRIPPIAAYFSVAWSVVWLSVVCLSHFCTLLKRFSSFRCRLAGTFVGSSDIFCQIGCLSPGKGET